MESGRKRPGRVRAWLFGAADAQHAFLGIALRHDEQVDHAEQVSAARERLGEAFDTAWSAGQASTVDAAVVAALEFTPRNPDAATVWTLRNHPPVARVFELSSVGPH